jgi:hypothetical protein
MGDLELTLGYERLIVPGTYEGIEPEVSWFGKPKTKHIYLLRDDDSVRGIISFGPGLFNDSRLVHYYTEEEWEDEGHRGILYLNATVCPNEVHLRYEDRLNEGLLDKLRKFIGLPKLCTRRQTGRTVDKDELTTLFGDNFNFTTDFEAHYGAAQRVFDGMDIGGSYSNYPLDEEYLNSLNKTINI